MHKCMNIRGKHKNNSTFSPNDQRPSHAIHLHTQRGKTNVALPGQLVLVQVQKILLIQTFDSKPSLSWNGSKLFVLQLAFLVLYWIQLVVLEIDSLEPYKWKEGQ